MNKHPENGRKITLDNPLPGHFPSVGRHFTGTNTWGSGRGGRHYATDLTCSCGWTPGHKRLGSGQIVADAKVTNEAPSKGGRSAANLAYQDHVDQVINDPLALPAEIVWKPSAPGARVTHAWAKGPGMGDMSLCGRISLLEDTGQSATDRTCDYCERITS